MFYFAALFVGLHTTMRGYGTQAFGFWAAVVGSSFIAAAPTLSMVAGLCGLDGVDLFTAGWGRS